MNIMCAHSAMTTRVARGREFRLTSAVLVDTKSLSPMTTKLGTLTRVSAFVKSKPLRLPSMWKSERRTHISRNTSMPSGGGFFNRRGGVLAYIDGAIAWADAAAYRVV